MDFATWMSACQGGTPQLNCSPMDTVCVANTSNLSEACLAKYNASDKTTPPPLITSDMADYQHWLQIAGGSAQSIEAAAGEAIPPNTPPSAWWGTPLATVTAASPAPVPTAPTGSAVVSSQPAAPDVSRRAIVSQASPASVSPRSNVIVSSAAPTTQAAADSAPNSPSIPLWLWLVAAAGAVILATRR